MVNQQPVIQKLGRPPDLERQARRRDEILSMAAKVFAEQGYRQTDVQVIADRLGIGKGTVYRYFPTKEALFFAAVDAGIHALSSRMEQVASSEADPVDGARKSVRAYLAYFDEHPEIVELLILERAEFKDRKQATYYTYRVAHENNYRAMIEEAMRDGHFRSMPVDRMLNVMNDLLYGAIFTNRFHGPRRSLEEQAEDILDIVFNGFLSPERQRRAYRERH